MGIKLFNFHMIPWCFHLMGNYVSCVQLPSETPVETIKLIKSDGLVKIYHRPINVSELMLEFPKHLVCHSDSFYIGQKIPALSENDELKLGHKYFLLPKHFFQSVLSFVTIASFASFPSQSSSSSNISKHEFVKKAANCQPFDFQKTPSGSLQIRVSDEFISKLMIEGKIKDDQGEDDNHSKSKNRVCTTPQLQKDYTQLVGSRSRQWKPKLEPIRESERRKLSSFSMKRRKTAHQSKGTHQIQRPEHLHVTSTKPPSKPKTRFKIKGKKSL
ncbi:PREDICTED: uncharacterized protein LOC104591916 [Nelumbo nucifera]|uniref:Uncharacterized protein LOC104591916 n=1 Tax=Nelumbo nucifera TaxID=4432 RepID=A0A1U7Z9W3_NELNU|nr:PREDICTED: uncharacterized protein LOC104591916 [Nelumbo nucifera]